MSEEWTAKAMQEQANREMWAGPGYPLITMKTEDELDRDAAERLFRRVLREIANGVAGAEYEDEKLVLSLHLGAKEVGACKWLKDILDAPSKHEGERV